LKDGYAKAGACIALGMTSSGVVDENDPAFALLIESITSDDHLMKLGASIGLGLAYAGKKKEEMRD